MSGVDEWISASAFTDANGQNKSTFDHTPEIDERMDINRSLRTVVYGMRPEAELTFDIVTMSDQAALARIVNALRRPEDVTVYLSGDGGSTEHAVVLNKYHGPSPLGGKPSIGGRYVLSVKGRELVTEIPDIGSTGKW